MKKSDLYLWRFVRYLRRTWKNKIAALVFILGGVVAATIDRECGTALIFCLLIGVPLFFTKENYMWF